MNKVISFFLILCFCNVGLIAQDLQVKHYQFTIEVNELNDSIYGKAVIDYAHNNSGAAVYLDFKNGKNKKPIKVLKVYDQNLGKPLKFEHKNDLLKIINPSNKDSQRISIEYAGMPENGLIIGKNMYGERTWFGDNWPNRASYWLPCIDDPASKATIEWVVQAPKKYIVTANGELTSDIVVRTVKGKTKKEFRRWIFNQRQPIPMKVAVIGIADFMMYVNTENKFTVENYYYRKTAEIKGNKMKYALNIMQYFDSLIAPYPFDKLRNVQSTTMFGGMENAGNIFYDEEAIAGDESNEALVAHEIAHQWFGNSATEKSFAHLWLSEGFATFLTNYYLRSRYGDQVFNDRIKDQYLKVQNFLKQSPLPVVDHSSKFMSLLNANSYEKGGLFLEVLRRNLGEDIFWKGIRQYYNTYKFSNANTDDFKKVMEDASGKDLTGIFQDWLYSTTLPSLP